MKLKIIFFIAVSQLLSGCMSIAWRGYNKPTESDYTDLKANKNCMSIGLQNLTERQKVAIIYAATDVCNILHLEEFKEKVISRKWLASCKLIDGKPDEISGEEVYSLIMQKISNYSINPRKPFAAIAQTQRSLDNLVYNRVAIMPSRIEAWYSPELLVKSELVNTIAHETMHIISDKFLDAGHGGDCANHDLVSYGIGNLVEVFWIGQHK
jgi:hypothetical protein